jgi:hypothetical protein
VQPPKLKVAVAPPGVVELVAIRELSEKRARVFRKRVKENEVDDFSKDLDFYVSTVPASHFQLFFTDSPSHILSSAASKNLHRRLRRLAGAPAMQVHVVS